MGIAPCCAKCQTSPPRPTCPTRPPNIPAGGLSVIRLAQAGCGYWGRNLLRVFANANGAQVVACCELDPTARQTAQRLVPGIEACDDFAQLLNHPDIDAIVLATPASVHFEQARAALSADKHVFVEKPLAMTTAEAEQLTAVAQQKNLRLMVGHTFLYNDAVRWVKDYIDRGELGEVYYAYFHRLNLGRVRSDVDVLWNLAPHDVSIALYWLGGSPANVTAQGVSYLQPGIWDVAFLQMQFPNNRYAHVHVSWLDPSKTRRAVVVGSKKMIEYDDTSADQRIIIYDKGIDRRELGTELGGFESFAEFQLVQRAGDIWIPRLQFREPLQVEAQHFIDCIASGQTPFTDGRNGTEVIRVLEAAHAAAV